MRVKSEGGYSSKRSRRSTRARATRKKTRRPRGGFVRAVKKVINSMTETKQAFHSSGDSLIMCNSGVNSSGDMFQILPNIADGGLPNQRIGNQITAQSLNVRGYLKLNVNDVTDSTKLPNVIARVMVVTMKSRPCYYDATGASATLATLLKKGGTTVGFTGVLSDIYSPINRDAFTVHYDKRFYLNQSYVNVTGASPPTTILAQDIKNTVKFFNFNVKCKNRVLKYDEDIGSDLLPSNFGPFLLVGYSYLDGSSVDTLSTNVGIQYDAVFNYEDA